LDFNSGANKIPPVGGILTPLIRQNLNLFQKILMLISDLPVGKQVPTLPSSGLANLAFDEAYTNAASLLRLIVEKTKRKNFHSLIEK